MIPATFPSVLDSSNRTKMLVYQVPSITGLTRWVDYIPVKSPASESDLTLANTYANEGFILTSKVNDITGLVPFKDYVPIYLDSTATKAWSADNDGYIPMAELAGLLLDFTTGNLDARINFSRTTNATVTNSAGVITYAPHNLLTYSEQFDNAAWTKTNATVLTNVAIAPNGTFTADKLIDTAFAAAHSVLQAINSTTNTLSVYAKAGENSFVWLKGDTGTSDPTTATIFNLTSGTIVSTGTTIINPSITAISDGWYRVSGIVSGSKNRVQIGGSSSGTDLAVLGDGVSGIYLWGAQLEVGASPTTYNPTTVKNLLGYSELFDNAAWTKSNSFVQTNLLKYSEDFSNASWSGFVAITANTEIAPNGYQTADTLTANTVYQPVTCTASTQYTFSFYAKLGTMLANKYLFAVRDDTAGVFIAQDISPSVTLTTSEWQRVTYTFTTPVGCTIVRPYIYRDSAGGANGTAYIWGAQLVQGSVAGDYRRTDAAALPVYYANHNGVVCAEKLVENTVNSTHGITEAYTAAIGTVVTFSCYMKAIDRNWARLTVNTATGANASAYFNLSTGDVGSIGGGTASIVSAGNGWYRCSITGTLTTANPTLAIFLANGDVGQTYTGDGTSGIYIFGAQLSDSASLDPYVLNAAAAPTAAAYYGARFDYDPVTLLAKGLLIEEQRTNLLTYSDDYTNAIWTKVGATTSGNVISLPTEGDRIFQAKTVVSGTVYTASVYLSGSGTVLMGFGTNTNTFKTVTLTSTPTRHEVVHTAGSTSGVFFAAYRSGTTATSVTVSYPQLEAGAFATSYIPTAASQVTRAADVATIQGSNFYSWYNQNEGSVSAKVSSLVAGNFQIDDGTANNRLTYINRLSGSGTVSSAIVNSAGVVDLSVSGWTSGVNNIAAGYMVDNYAGVINNGTVATDTSAGTPIVNTLRISGSTTTTANFTFKSISYYPQRLSDSVLKGLTA